MSIWYKVSERTLNRLLFIDSRSITLYYLQYTCEIVIGLIILDPKWITHYRQKTFYPKKRSLIGFLFSFFKLLY